MAPGMEPMPPKTAAVKARIPGMEPVVGWSVGTVEHSSTPAMAASAEPMAKVVEMVWLTLMPMSWAASRSSDTARMALPVRVLPVNRVRPTITRMQAATVSSTSPVMTILPSAREMGFMVTTDVKFLGLEDQISWAAFCRK